MNEGSPDRKKKFYEVKYKIPMKWTKKFNPDDIVPVKDKLKSAIHSEFGMVNSVLPKKKGKAKANKAKSFIYNQPQIIGSPRG